MSSMVDVECFKSLICAESPLMLRHGRQLKKKPKKVTLAETAPSVLIETAASPESCHTELFPWKVAAFSISFLAQVSFQCLSHSSSQGSGVGCKGCIWGFNFEITPWRAPNPASVINCTFSAWISPTLSLPTDLWVLFFIILCLRGGLAVAWAPKGSWNAIRAGVVTVVFQERKAEGFECVCTWERAPKGQCSQIIDLSEEWKKQVFLAQIRL